MNSIFDMAGCVALVTGSTKGIGRAIVELFADHGAKVVISSRNGEEAHSSATLLNERAGKDIAMGHAFDLADGSSCDALVDAAIAKWGRLDAVVANAFASHVGPASATPPEEFIRVFRANVVNNLLLAERARPHLAKSSNPSVTFVGSVAAHMPTPAVSAYSISKRALLQAVQNAALEWGPEGVRVNIVVPGTTRTYTMEPIWTDDRRLQAYLRGLPLPRIIEPEEIAAACLLLAAPSGKSITAQSIVIDSGRSLATPPNLPADFEIDREHER